MNSLSLNSASSFANSVQHRKRVAASNWRLENKQALGFAGKGITAVATEDMDLDGHKDLVCAVGNQVDVWRANGVEVREKAVYRNR